MRKAWDKNLVSEGWPPHVEGAYERWCQAQNMAYEAASEAEAEKAKVDADELWVVFEREYNDV